ncbi:MAG: transporter [Candidatus Omnitrophica bacterium]|nr:transporter [Candidatus Omnitrophota bacterium]
MKILVRSFAIIFLSGFCSYLAGAAVETPAAVDSGSQTAILEPEPAKLILVDATPVDPGHVELNLSYSIAGAAKQWQTSGNRSERKHYRMHSFDSVTNIGILDGLDIGLTQGIAILRDKENNYDETGGAVDPDTGESLDETDGPHKGHGRSDLIVNARWRFYQNRDQCLRFAYVPSILIPTGRRSNFDHLGPSQGYPSLTNTFAVTKDFSRVTTSANAGYAMPLERMDDTGNSAGALNLGWGIGCHVCHWLQPQTEVLYSHNFERHGKGGKVVSLVFGFIMPITDHVRLDTGIVQDIGGSGNDQTTSGIFKIVTLI